MKGYKRVFMTLAIGTAMAFPAFSVPASAGEGSGSGSASGTGLQVKSEDGPGGAEYTYRNTKRKRFGDMGQRAEIKKGPGFVDDNGDGINDLAPDHDGDGIPNGQDSDWVRNERDGTGYQHGQRMGDGGEWSQGSQSRGNRGGRATR
jgi:hypothetical protein